MALLGSVSTISSGSMASEIRATTMCLMRLGGESFEKRMSFFNSIYKRDDPSQTSMLG